MVSKTIELFRTRSGIPKKRALFWKKKNKLTIAGNCEDMNKSQSKKSQGQQENEIGFQNRLEHLPKFDSVSRSLKIDHLQKSPKNQPNEELHAIEPQDQILQGKFYLFLPIIRY